MLQNEKYNRRQKSRQGGKDSGFPAWVQPLFHLVFPVVQLLFQFFVVVFQAVQPLFQFFYFHIILHIIILNDETGNKGATTAEITFACYSLYTYLYHTFYIILNDENFDIELCYPNRGRGSIEVHL